jgi:hypothetical protein
VCETVRRVVNRLFDAVGSLVALHASCCASAVIRGFLTWFLGLVACL